MKALMLIALLAGCSTETNTKCDVEFCEGQGWGTDRGCIAPSPEQEAEGCDCLNDAGVCTSFYDVDGGV